MKQQNSTTNKTKAAIVFLIVMIIVLLSNFYRLQNSKKATEDINTIFNDRLVVTDYIFQYANDLHSIKAIAIQNDLNETQKKVAIATLLNHIHAIDKLYLKTSLTSKEKNFFVSFLASCTTIEINSQNFNWPQVTQSSNQAIKTLKLLSKIQINEGKIKLDHSNSIHRDNTTWGELQTALLVVLGAAALYLLIVKRKKIKVKIPESPSMN